MIEKVSYTPEAEQDVVEAYGWYEAREPGLGEDFLRCVEACLLTVQRHPKLYPVAVDEFRRALVRRFPYAPNERQAHLFAIRVAVDAAHPLVC
jgi:hypothetical protein